MVKRGEASSEEAETLYSGMRLRLRVVDIFALTRQTTDSAMWAFLRSRNQGRSYWKTPWLVFGEPSPIAMTEQRVSYTLDSTLETVDSAEQTASRIAAESGFGEDEIMQISMAVREVVVNAVLHGNAYDPEKKVSLDFETTKGDLVITVRDQGKGLDKAKIPDPLSPDNLLKTSGRGIFLIRSFMDEVEINPSPMGTEIKLVKHVRGSTASGKEASQ
jgi:serine/threonine-protein kinase RsbW